MTSSALAASALIAMVTVQILWFWRWNKLRKEVELTIKQSHPSLFNKLVKGWTDIFEISLIPRRRFIKFLRDEEYVSLEDSGFSEKCRTCYRRYRRGLWLSALIIAYAGLWFWLDSNVKIG